MKARGICLHGTSWPKVPRFFKWELLLTPRTISATTQRQFSKILSPTVMPQIFSSQILVSVSSFFIYQILIILLGVYESGAALPSTSSTPNCYAPDLSMCSYLHYYYQIPIAPLVYESETALPSTSDANFYVPEFSMCSYLPFLSDSDYSSSTSSSAL